VRRVFEDAIGIGRRCSAGGVRVIDPQDIADELIAAEREHKAIGRFTSECSLPAGMRIIRYAVKEWHRGP
jgi:hypothetical protein